MNSSFYGYFRLIRPGNLFIAVLAILLGGYLQGFRNIPDIWFACISGMLIMAGGNAVNDYFDIEIDSRNKPGRPLPSGSVRPREALAFSNILFALGVFLSIFIGLELFLLALFSAIALYVYSARLKKSLLVGNITVSLISALAFIYGGMAAGGWDKAVTPAVFAFLFHFGRELIKDTEDMEADSSAVAKTLPIRYGKKSALISASAIFLFLILFTPLPYYFQEYHPVYLWIVILGVDAVLIFILFFMWLNPVTERLHQVSNLLKIDMLVGLLAIYAGFPGN